jgi:hypothetical protein
VASESLVLCAFLVFLPCFLPSMPGGMRWNLVCQQASYTDRTPENSHVSIWVVDMYRVLATRLSRCIGTAGIVFATVMSCVRWCSKYVPTGLVKLKDPVERSCCRRKAWLARHHRENVGDSGSRPVALCVNPPPFQALASIIMPTINCLEYHGREYLAKCCSVQSTADLR